MSEAGALRDLPRLREISRVFVRHGLGDLVRRIGVASLLERTGEVLHRSDAARGAQLEPQQRMRMAFEELGPTFVKLGQMLSLREDLLPPQWTAELARWLEAHEQGMASRVVLKGTHSRALEIVPLALLKKFAVDLN